MIRLIVCALLLNFAIQADELQEVQRPVTHVAMALTAGNPSDAMTPFDKAFAGYDKLSDYFAGLTNAFQLASDLEFAGQTISADEATLTVRWALNLSDQQSGYTQNRSAEIKVRLIRKNAKWKIVEFSPIALFDPQQR